MDEAKLIRGLRRRRRGALDQAIEQFTPYVGAVVWRVLAPSSAGREDVEEAVSDVFLSLWAHAEELDPARGLRPWLGTVARNRARDVLRRLTPTCSLEEGRAAPEEGLKVTVPLSYVEPVTVDIGAEGPGMGSLTDLHGGPVALESVTLSPFYLGITYRCLDSGDPDHADVPLFFLFQDGSLLTRAQLVETRISGHQRGKGNWEYSFRLRSVLDVETLEAVVFDGMAYPLDGSAAYAYQVDERLQTFQLPLMEPLSEEMGYSVPVQALCQGLGASYVWDGDAQRAVMVYRDVEIVLTVGSTAALVDGLPMELHAAPALRGDTLLCEYFPFEAWHIDMCAAYEEYTPRGEHNVREAWLISP